MLNPSAIRLGTRGSPLALAQAEEAHNRLITAHPHLAEPGLVEIVPITTSGDKDQSRRLSEIGGKGLFTKEIEQALADRRIDVAVHSMKDVETWIGDSFTIAAILPREDPRDVFLSRDAASLADLAAGSVVGTASLRRQAQILHRRPDLKVRLFRGNVQTRLRKLEAGEADATLLALAGLRRMGLEHLARAVLEPSEMLPAVAQGAIGLECRSDDTSLLELLRAVNDEPSAITVAAERAMLAALDGSCRTPIGGLATLETGRLRLRALLARPDGSALWETERQGAPEDAVALGTDAGAQLRREADQGLFE